jgi:hypothetical protein
MMAEMQYTDGRGGSGDTAFDERFFGVATHDANAFPFLPTLFRAAARGMQRPGGRAAIVTDGSADGDALRRWQRDTNPAAARHAGTHGDADHASHTDRFRSANRDIRRHIHCDTVRDRPPKRHAARHRYPTNSPTDRRASTNR